MKDLDKDPLGSSRLRAIEAGMIGAVAQWCECLHGADPLLKALEVLGKSIEAEAVLLSRHSRTLGAKARVLAWDRQPKTVLGGRLERSYAASVLGAYFDKARPGSLWFKTMVEDNLGSDLIAFHSNRHLRELVVVPLEAKERSVDFLEIHLAEKPRNYQQAVLNMLAPMLARTWHNRASGLFTESLLRMTVRPHQVVDGVPILSADNPAGLSRAEYRVCLLLSRGKTMDELKSELGIGKSTLRTHLSHLYAKTGSSNAGELIYRLVAAEPFMADGGCSDQVA